MWFIARKGAFGEWKPTRSGIFPIRRDAEAAANCGRSGEYKVFDAEHEPGRSILRKANPF